MEDLSSSEKKVSSNSRLEKAGKFSSEIKNEVCSLHFKKLEAYCLYDKQLLCIDCILSDDHKTTQVNVTRGGPGRHERITHEIISIEKAIQ